MRIHRDFNRIYDFMVIHEGFMVIHEGFYG